MATALLQVTSATAAERGSVGDELAQGEAEGQEMSGEDGSAGESGFKLTGFPMIFYTPETELGLGGGVVLTHREEDSPKEARPQNVSLMIALTSLKQAFIQLEPNLYLDEQRWEIRTNASAKHWPADFYGIGRNTPDDARESFTTRDFRVDTRVLRRVVGPFRLGLAYDFGVTSMVDFEAGRAIDREAVTGSRGGRNAGAGIAAAWDSRDQLFFPTSGGWYRAEALAYQSWLGGEFGYATVKVDLRQYLSIAESWVLALQALGEDVRGDAPFTEYPKPALRGFYRGRFRDRLAITSNAELRFPVMGRVSAVVFGGVGNVASGLGSFGWDDAKWGAGGGLRFALLPKEKLNLRFDLAWSPWGTEPYFQLREAF